MSFKPLYCHNSQKSYHIYLSFPCSFRDLLRPVFLSRSPVSQLHVSVFSQHSPYTISSLVFGRCVITRFERLQALSSSENDEGIFVTSAVARRKASCTSPIRIPARKMENCHAYEIRVLESGTAEDRFEGQ
jgi:hypothetical protein